GEALHPPGEARGGAGLPIKERRPDRLARAPADAFAPKLAEDRGGERQVDLVDRGLGLKPRAPDPRAELLSPGLEHGARFVMRIERGDERRAFLEDADLLPRDPRPRFAQDLGVLEPDI